jgi:hypothetical protein
MALSFLGFALTVNITIILTEPIYENRTSTVIVSSSTMAESKCELCNNYLNGNIYI